MRTDDFNFKLPEELIAQYPTTERGASRLLVLDRADGRIIHGTVADIASFVEPGTLMVFNDSKVRKARLFGVVEDSGAKVEFLLLNPLAGSANPLSGSSSWMVMCSKSRKQRIGRTYAFPGGLAGRIAGKAEDERILEFAAPVGDSYLDTYGHMPLPPYIRRGDESSDERRYQTIYAKTVGSAACPTAGLHFTEAILGSLAEAGIEMEWVTLHVGLGTFLPVRVEHVENHVMHEEWYNVPKRTSDAVARAKAEGRKILAVGTTSLRTLESASDSEGRLTPGPGRTSIFIYSGYEFKLVDRLFTNFHTPKSTLLMLVSAFAGRERILGAYEEAIGLGYRFFSYGDAMLIR
ncbi:MAG: tRNA preQ1(34) S-adenosylmethionine ribosyltransferase-isomerase QueA [Spirochaetes bacterium]|nr:tRNA preQ1(34) S-adenosylmethionine ribosyltransferase-isomerase QueA [Spirochaetota bacterium]